MVTGADDEKMTRRDRANRGESYMSLMASQSASLVLAATEDVGNDILSYWFRVEADTHVAPDYMRRQDPQPDLNINDKMRAILMDWLVAGAYTRPLFGSIKASFMGCT
jgi:hypothetical protein